MAPCDSSWPVLPANCSLEYLNEGAANIVYRVIIQQSTPPSSVIDEYGDDTPPPTEIEPVEDSVDLEIFKHKLLRLRKNLPTTHPSIHAQASWETLIKPLFNSNELVDQTLVRLESSTLISSLNDDLRAWEAQSSKSANPRPKKRHGVYLADDQYGLLVTDMTAVEPGQRVFEFKPKWLLQSPAAPADSKRCRTCALTARVNYFASRNGGDKRKLFCPLDLVSENPAVLLNVAQQLLDFESTSLEALPFASWLLRCLPLERLRKLQGLHDEEGVFIATTETEKLQIAMTLRDCTIFVRFPKPSGDPGSDILSVEARIGDLDLKSKDKHEHWKSVERPLISEGWYQGTDITGTLMNDVCALSR